MELKRGSKKCVYFFIKLLIVPYGIETLLPICELHATSALLIVPYGIETLKSV